MKEKVLITGASGFIGFHLIEAALHSGLEVYAGIRPDSEIGHLKGYDIQFCELIYTNRSLLTQQVAATGCDYIIHAAGATRANSQQAYNTINAHYALTLAHAALDGLGDRLKRFVFLSSLAAIGPADKHDTLITEDSAPAPVTAYGRSKLLAEKKLQTVSALPLVVVRPTAVYGPRERDIFIMLRALSRGIEAYIGRQEQQLSFVYVKDLASAVMKAMFSGLTHTSFNISDGLSYDQYALANASKQLLHRRTLKLHLPYGMIYSLAYVLEKVNGWQNKTPVLNREKLHELTAANWHCSIAKAHAQLQYQPQYSLEQGLQETWQWYEQHKWL